jgi:hypothetical protein
MAELSGVDLLEATRTDERSTREELRCVLAVVRHGDRTPKQKLKVNPVDLCTPLTCYGSECLFCWKCVLAVVRHGDRTPKQKLKVNPVDLCAPLTCYGSECFFVGSVCWLL